MTRYDNYGIDKIVNYTVGICLFLLLIVLLIHNISADIISVNSGIDNYTVITSSQSIEGFGFGEIPSVPSPGGDGGIYSPQNYTINNTICNLILMGENLSGIDYGLLNFSRTNCPKPLAVVPSEGKFRYWWIILVFFGLFGLLIAFDLLLNKKKMILLLMGKKRKKRD